MDHAAFSVIKAIYLFESDEGGSGPFSFIWLLGCDVVHLQEAFEWFIAENLLINM